MWAPSWHVAISLKKCQRQMDEQRYEQELMEKFIWQITGLHLGGRETDHERKKTSFHP